MSNVALPSFKGLLCVYLTVVFRASIEILIKAHLYSPGQLALLARSQLPAIVPATHHLVPYRSQQTAAPPVKRSRLDNSAEFVVTKLDDLINWARKVRLLSPSSLRTYREVDRREKCSILWLHIHTSIRGLCGR